MEKSSRSENLEIDRNKFQIKIEIYINNSTNSIRPNSIRYSWRITIFFFYITRSLLKNLFVFDCEF